MPAALPVSAAYEPLNKYDTHRQSMTYFTTSNKTSSHDDSNSDFVGHDFSAALSRRLDSNCRSPWSDVWCAVLFLLNILAMVVIGCYGVAHRGAPSQPVAAVNVSATDSPRKAVEAITGIHGVHAHGAEHHETTSTTTTTANDAVAEHHDDTPSPGTIAEHLAGAIVHRRDDTTSSSAYEAFVVLSDPNAQHRLVARNEDDYPKHFKEALDIASITHTAARHGLSATYWVFGAVLSIVTSFMVACLFVFVLKSYTGIFISGAYFLQIAIWLGLTIFSFVKRKYGLGTIFILLFVSYLLLAPKFLRRAALSKIMIREVLHCVTRFPSLYITALIGTFFKLVVLILWMLCVAGIWIFCNNHNTSHATRVCLALYFTFSLMWISFAVDAVINMTVSTVFAAYYNFGYESTLNNNRIVFPPHIERPTLTSARRALTNSFGSACLGACILSFFRVVKLLLSIIKPADPSSIIEEYALSCYTFVFGSIEEIVRYFTHHIYVNIAVFNESFSQAAKRTKELFSSRRGFDSVASDVVVHATLTVSATLAALFTVALCLGLAFIETAFERKVDFTTKLYFAYYMIAIGFACCFMFSSVITEVIHSGVCTTFVCLVETPEVVLEKQPKLAAAAEDAFEYLDIR